MIGSPLLEYCFDDRSSSILILGFSLFGVISHSSVESCFFFLASMCYIIFKRTSLYDSFAGVVYALM